MLFTDSIMILQVEGLGIQGPDNPDGTPQPPPSPTSASVSARVAIVVEAARRGEDLTRLYLSVKRPTGANVQDDDGVGSAVPASSFFAESPVESPTGGATAGNGSAGSTVAAAGSALSHSSGHVSGGSGGVGSSTTPPVASPVLSDSGRPDSVSRGRRRLVVVCVRKNARNLSKSSDSSSTNNDASSVTAVAVVTSSSCHSRSSGRSHLSLACRLGFAAAIAAMFVLQALLCTKHITYTALVTRWHSSDTQRCCTTVTATTILSARCALTAAEALT
jgi:hypothetical protein